MTYAINLTSLLDWSSLLSIWYRIKRKNSIKCEYPD